MENSINYSKGNDEEQVMHSKSDNIELMINDEADKVIKNVLNQPKISKEFGINDR